MAERTEWTLQVEGMTCDHCAKTIDETLRRVPGVIDSSTSHPDSLARVVTEASVKGAKLAGEIAGKGYRVVGHSSRAWHDTSSPSSPLPSAPSPSPSSLSPSLSTISKRASGSSSFGSSSFDLVIVGTGGAAFGAALKASELGARVAMVERGALGGTCVNVGCVPSKTLIRAAEALHRAQRTPFSGISVAGRLTDFSQIMAQKDSLVAGLRQAKYADVLAALPTVQLFEGQGEFVERGALRVGLQVGDTVLRADRFVIATGASPHAAAIPGLAEAGGFLTSTDALALKELPPSLIVLGGRYIALELAQAFARLGSKVTVVQRSDHILPTEDDDLTDALTGLLREDGIDVLTSARTRRVQRDGGDYLVDVEIGDEYWRLLRAAQLLVATGRRPNTGGIGLERIGVNLAADGTIQVDEMLQTSAAGVYAAGDVIGEPAFVYTAAYEGNLAAENALTGSAPRRRDYSALPWVMFTDPQVAVVGLNEKRAREAGIAIDVAKLPLTHLPRALAAHDTRGLIKLVKERGGDRLLGASILAPEAGDLVMEPALAMKYGIGVSQLASTFHPYLTQAEGIKLAAQAFNKDISKLSCCAA